MGTGSGAMAGSAVLFLVLCSLPYMHAQCCTKKIVTGAAAEDKGLVGTYTLLNDVSEDKNVACFDGCVYAREGKGRSTASKKWLVELILRISAMLQQGQQQQPGPRQQQELGHRQQQWLGHRQLLLAQMN